METWTQRAYADPVPYLRHRARVIVELGPPVEQDDLLLDLACGDGGLADFLPCRYLGVDADAKMIEEARALGRSVVKADLNDFEPEQPVDVTTIFRAIYDAHDRLAFLRRVASFTTKKLVFDLNPRQYRLDDVLADLRAAGFDGVALRPFFVPQTVALPAPLSALLRAAERSGPLARTALRLRFTYLVAGFRSEKE